MADQLTRGERRSTRVPGDPSDARGFAASVAAWCEVLLVRQYSGRTVENREEHLAHLAGWLLERNVSRPQDVTRPMLQRYQRWLFYYRKANGTPLSIRRQYERMTSVRLFFRHLARANQILYNPAADLDMPRLTRRLPRWVLTIAEVERVLAQPDLHDPLGIRDRAMLETLYATGVRRFELAGLSLFDLDAERGTLMVRLGKGRKDRMVPIGERAVRWVEKYLGEVRPLLATEPDEGVLFLGVDGQAMGLHRLTELVRDHVDAAGIGKRGSCHLFRHTLATLMLEGGADVRFVQEMLGHADIHTTQLYTQVSIRQLQRVYVASHPAALAVRWRRPAVSAEAPTEDGAALLAALADEATEEETDDADRGMPEPLEPGRFAGLTTVRRRPLGARASTL